MTTPAVVDLNSSTFATQTWVQSDRVNYELVNGTPVPIGDLPEATSVQRPTAEWANGVNAVLRQVSAVFRGTSMPDAITISTYFRLPRYTTGARPSAVTQGEGAVIFDTTLDRICTSNGTTWLAYLAAGDVSGTIAIFGDGGLVDGDFDYISLNENDFLPVDDGDGNLSLALRDGGVALSRLANGAARTVPCRAANSSGAHASVQGQGPGTVLSEGTDNTLAFRSIALLGDGSMTLLEADLSALATNAFTDGAETVGALAGTAGGTASAGANWGVVNGTGLRFSSTTGGFSSSAQTGPHWYITVSSIPGWRPGKDLIIDLVITSGSFAAGNDQLRFGLWGLAASPLATNSARMRMGIRGNLSGTQSVGTLADTTVQSAGNALSPLAISAWIQKDGRVMVGHGTYSGGWPTFDYVVNNVVIGTGIDGIYSSACRFAIGLNTSAGTPSIDVSRWRFRQS